MKTIEINGETYVRQAGIPPAPPTGSRHVVVIDRGWIYAGDLEDKGGRIILTNAVWLFRWVKIGFAAVLEDPLQDGVDLRPVRQPVDVPAHSEIYRIPVAENWGIK